MEREKLENNAESAHKAAEMMKFSATSVPADVCHGVASSVANLPTQNASGNCLQIELGYPCTFLSHLHRLTVPCHSRSLVEQSKLKRSIAVLLVLERIRQI